MESTLEKVPAKISFVHFGEKKIDWRFDNANMQDEPATLYWIGIIDLTKVTKDQTMYPISFAERNGIVKDGYWPRHEDGALAGSNGPIVYKYDLSSILPELLKAKRSGKLFHNVFLEETVQGFGSHMVRLMYQKREKLVYGISSKLPWSKLPVQDWYHYSSVDTDDDFKKMAFIEILHHPSYRWKK